MVKKMLYSTIKLILILCLVTLGIFALTRLIIVVATRPSIKSSIDQSPNAPVAIVFGAGLTRDGLPSPVLQDRVRAAANLYFAGKVQKLLMSGDNRFQEYNEPQAMREFAFSLGVPMEDIVPDFAGRRTYDTCFRAKHIFGVENAVLVTQNFHLPRALFLCKQLGLKSSGFSADLRNYSRYSRTIWNIREIPATLTAVIDVWIRKPIPVLGPLEKID
jgi:SanA protein